MHVDEFVETEDIDYDEHWYAATDDHAGLLKEQTIDVPAQVPWPASWIDLVQRIRALQGPTFWEIFSGSARLTAAFMNEGLECGPPLDAIYSSDFDLLNYMFVAVVVGLLAAHLVDLLHLAPPCATFSVALNGSEATRVRSFEKPMGLDG